MLLNLSISARILVENQRAIMKFRSLILGLVILSVGCGPTYRPFTAQMQDKFGWTEDDLKHVQFYLSNDIVLRRNLSKGESVIDDGKIVIERGTRIEEIIIPEGTPGVLQFMPKSNRMAISFERGGEKFLMFGPNPKFDGRYMLLGSTWDRKMGEVTYQGKKYHTSSRSALASLLVDINSVHKVTVSRRKASGRRI